MIGYHVTLAEHLPRILAEGLRPQIGARAEKLGESTPGVFFFPDRDACEDALMNWLGEELGEDADIVILEVDLRSLGGSTRSEAAYEIQSPCALGPERIVRVLDERFEAISMQRAMATPLRCI